MSPIPILVSGRAEVVGRGVVEGIKPEYEAIHFTLAASIADELPLLLAGKAPSSPSSTLGSGNWASPPQALLIGGSGYTDEDIEKLRKLVDETEGAAKIPWLRIDPSKGTPPTGIPGPEYAVKMVGRMKEGLQKLKDEGKLGPGEGGVYLV